MRSIQRRLSLGLIGVLIALSLLLMQTSLWLFETGLRRYLENDLHQQSENLLIALVRTETGIGLEPARLSASFERPLSGEYFRIEIGDKSWRSRSSWDQLLPVPEITGLQKALGAGPGEQQLLLYRADYQRFGEVIVIVVARDFTPMLHSFRRVQWIGLGLLVAAVIGVLLLQGFIVKRALRPLETVRRQVAQLQQGQREELDTDVPEELQSLVNQINHLLLHTEETLKRSRNALGNLGHALKTPLAVLVSLSARTELSAYPQIRANLRTQLEQIQQRLGRELARARLSGEALPGAHFNCDAELPGLFSTLVLIHNRNLQLDWQAAPNLSLPWDREDMLELLGNLLDNACKWAAAHVQLDIRAVSGQFVIRVDDDGPGIDSGKREEVLSRGARLDEQTDGHGLGLGIVRDIVEHCEGKLTLEDSSLGGLGVVIHLPGVHS